MKINFNKHAIVMGIYLLVTTHFSYANLLIINEYPNGKINVYLNREIDNETQEQTFEIPARKSQYIIVPSDSYRMIITLNTNGNEYIKHIDLPLPKDAVLKIKKPKTSNFIAKKLVHWASDTNKKVKGAAWLQWAKKKNKSRE